MADTQHPPQSSHQHTAHTHSHEPVSLISRILAIGGLILVVVIVLWGIIHLLSLSGGWFSSFFSSSRSSAIQVSAPPQGHSGEAVPLAWKYTPSEKGNYALLYPCKADLSFSFPTGDSLVQIPCGTAYTLGTATSSAVLVPLLTGTTSVSMPLTVLYIPSATTTSARAPAQGSTTITIGTKQTAVSPTPATPTTSSTPEFTAKPTGPADLSVTILSLNADAFGNATVTFDISNLGGSSSGTYYFSAQLPTVQPYSYSSPAQASLGAGSHVVSTLNFTSASPGTFTVNVTSSSDSNASNNYASQYLSAPYNVQYQYNTPSQQYVPPQTYTGGSQCYWNGSTYVCNQASYNNGQPYYVNNTQYPYIVPNSY